ncbi:MAG: hypothetical protein ACUVRX_12330, partial [Actinomycetota bacterium]
PLPFFSAFRHLLAASWAISFLVFIFNLIRHLPRVFRLSQGNGVIPIYLEYFLILRPPIHLEYILYEPIRGFDYAPCGD